VTQVYLRFGYSPSDDKKYPAGDHISTDICVSNNSTAEQPRTRFVTRVDAL